MNFMKLRRFPCIVQTGKPAPSLQFAGLGSAGHKYTPSLQITDLTHCKSQTLFNSKKKLQLKLCFIIQSVKMCKKLNQRFTFPPYCQKVDHLQYLVIFLSVLHLERQTVIDLFFMSVCDRLSTLQKGNTMTINKIMLPTGMCHITFTYL